MRDGTLVMSNGVQRVCAWTRDVHAGRLISGAERRCVPLLRLL